MTWTLFWQLFILIGWLGLWVNLTLAGFKGKAEVKLPHGYSNN